MNKLVVPLLLLFLSKAFFLTKVHAQEKNGTRMYVSSEVVNTANFHIYDPPLELHLRYESQTTSKYDYPEQLLLAVLSCTDEEWNISNHHPSSFIRTKSDLHYEKVRQSDPDITYFELDYKLTFNYAGKEFVMIRFFIHSDETEKPAIALRVMEKYNERWVISDNFSTIGSFTLMRIDKEKLRQLLFVESSDPIISDVLSRVVENGSLNLDLLAIEEAKWYIDPINQEYIDYFKDERSW